MPAHVSRPINLNVSNTLSTTNQPSLATKAYTTHSVYPGNSRPNVNGLNSGYDPALFSGPFGRARPLKLWRKQLQPNSVTHRSKVSIGMINAPGGVVFRGAACNCGATTNGKLYVSEDVFVPNIQESTPGPTVHNAGYIQVGDPASPNSYQINTGIYETKYLGSCPKTRVIKSARTRLSRAYYTDHAAYLQSRCKTFRQKETISPAPNVTYVNPVNGQPIWPSNSHTGSQVYNTNNCPNAAVLHANPANACKATTIYKPNNKKYGCQGAVSASSRLARLKVDTINTNGASFASAFGEAAANAGRYHGTSTGPYFVKNKIAPYCNYYRRAIHRTKTIC